MIPPFWLFDLLKRRLEEASELACMQPFGRHGGEFLHRQQADLQVLVL